MDRNRLLSLPSLLAEALNETLAVLRKEWPTQWTPFAVSGPRPVMHGAWHVLRPGLQVIVAEVFPCDGTPPPALVIRPTAIKVFSGGYKATLLEPMQDGAMKLEYDVDMQTAQELLTVPGTRYAMKPDADGCLVLMVRNGKFPTRTETIVPHQLFRPSDTLVSSALRKAHVAITAH